MEKSSKIYVAGHRGLVGSAIVRLLQSEGYSNIIVRSSKELDLRRQAEVEAFFENERPEYVFLAAAKVGGILANNTYKAEFIYDNIMISTNIIYSSYKYDVKKLLNLGSSCIYPKYAPQPMKEECLLEGGLEPTNESYAVAKIAALKLCKYCNEQYGTNFISVMPTNLYGPNDNFNLETAHALPALIRKFHLAKLLRSKCSEDIKMDTQRYPIGFNITPEHDLDRKLKEIGITPEYVMLWGTGEPCREFLYVDDLASACILLMERYDYEDIGEFVNVGVGVDIKIKDLAEMVRNVVGFDGEIKHDRSKPDGTPRKLLDISRIKSLGWEPRVSLQDGIARTYKWYEIQTNS